MRALVIAGTIAAGWLAGGAHPLLIRLGLALFTGVMYVILEQARQHWKLVLATTVISGLVAWWLMGFFLSDTIRIPATMLVLVVVASQGKARERVIYIDDGGYIWMK